MSLLLHIIVTYIKENIITKLQKLYSPPRNPMVGNKSAVVFVKKPLCTGNLSPACKILIERPVILQHFMQTLWLRLRTIIIISTKNCLFFEMQKTGASNLCSNFDWERFIFNFLYFGFRCIMKWSEFSDTLFACDILVIEPYQFTPKCKKRGKAWTELARMWQKL